MRAVKILFSIVFLLVLVLVFAFGALVYFVDPDKLKPVIIEEVKNETGYLLSIDGKLSFSLYPLFSIKVDHMQLKSPDQPAPFMDASGVKIASNLVDLWQARDILQGKIYISSLRLMNINAQNISAHITGKKNILTVDDIKASLYGGKLTGVLSGRDFAQLPKWQWDMQLDKVQLKPLLQDVNGPDSKIKISGLANFRLQADTSGKGKDELIRRLNGTSVYSVQNGIVEGIDINYFLQLADATLHKQSINQIVNTNQTSFSQLAGTAAIQNGVVNTRDTNLIAPTFITRAQGSLDLVPANLDIELKIKPQLQNTKLHWDIPVLVTGDLAHPEIRLDVLEIQKILAGMEIENLKQKAAAQIQKHIPGKTGEFLQNLLGVEKK